jgi:CHAT domain-containing protein
VHLATHGAFDPGRPRLSGLVLARGERLFFDDVAALRIEADLAVLSGCETAKGAWRPGEGVLGLVRAFFLAGCPRVVASSWRVSDSSTRDLMVRFHERMAKGGETPAAALRAAQVESARAAGAASHPYHWAAFQLWGLPE